MASTRADRDREQRRARHTRRVSALREQREERNRTARESITRSVDPFALVGAEPYAEVFG